MIGKKLCNLEKEGRLKGHDLKDIANLLGVSVTTIQGYKKGLFRPSAKTVVRMRENGFSEKACLDPAGIEPTT